ncbi:MAG: EAL domain-containing protein [Clostridia bacterium]|nr:EAL domain-containing protein [Clostridia bacterium]
MYLTKNVLIIDDNKMNRQMLSLILCGQYEILDAENGKAGLEILHNLYASISVILLDLIMPVMNGYEVLAEIRRDAFLRNIPVIAISQDEELDAAAKAKALSFGVQDFIQMGSLPEEIKQRVENAIMLRKTANIMGLVQRDSLTGLSSEKYFYNLVEELLEKNPEKKYDIICSDIERFKLVNELYGVDEGDALLKYVAQMIRDKIQGTGICGRLNGDIFAALVEHREEYEEQNFLESVEYINQFNESLHSVIKFGIYAIEDRTLPVSIMCTRACLALASIKGKYGTYFSYFNDEIRQKLLDEQFILSNMKNSLLNKEFVVYFQPKYDLMSEKICSAEALVRWVHPEKGIIMPNRFIKVFEDNGFITELDIYVLEESCKWIRSWIDRGKPPIPVSVNVSRADIYNPDIDKILLSMLKKYGLSPNHIYIEITESAYTENAEQMLAVIKRLKDLGFTVEMDDFGSGYSSLNMLSEIPIDVLKLDMRFVQNQDSSRNKRDIMSFVISLAKWMNLTVIAEGVENEDQVNLLKSLGCHRVQGFFFSKPLPLNIFEELVHKVNVNNVDSVAEAPTAYDENILRLDAGKQSMLILDADSEEFAPFQRVFKQKFAILQAKTIQEAENYIHKKKSNISLLIFSVTKDITMELISCIIHLCKQYDIPVITIHSSMELVSQVVSLGVFDCIFKPYVIETLENTVDNTLCRKQCIHLQKEMQFNDAIIEMKQRAEVDSLSGLLNRSELKIRIQDFYNQEHNKSAVFILIDIDHFKSINIALGYGLGDKILCAVGKMLETIFVETNYISRINSDLFAVFMPFKIERKILEQKLEKVCHAIAYDNSNLNLTLTCSAGVCFSPEYATSVEDLYNHANIALSNARVSQKNRFLFYDGDMRDPIDRKHQQQTLIYFEDVSDGILICDAFTGEIIFINDEACKIFNITKNSRIGTNCYQFLEEKIEEFNFCFQDENRLTAFYEADITLEGANTKLHLKAKIGELNGKKVKIHYFQSIKNT